MGKTIIKLLTPYTVRAIVVLSLFLPATSSCGLDSQSPEEKWQAVYNEGVVELTGSNYAKAKRSFEDALSIARKIDPNGKRVADSLLGLGEVAIDNKQFDRANGYLTKAKTIYQSLWNEKLGGVNNRDIAIYLAKTLLNNARALVGRQKLQDALVEIKRARHVAEVAPAPDYVTHDILGVQAEITKQLGLQEESAQLADGAAFFENPRDGKNSRDTRNMTWQQMIEAGDQAASALNNENAAAMYKCCKKLLDKNKTDGFPRGRLYLSIGKLQVMERQYEEAEKNLLEAHRILQSSEKFPRHKGERYYTSEAMEKLAAVYLHTNRLKESLAMYKKTIEIERNLKHLDKFARRERKLMKAMVDGYKRGKDYVNAERLQREKLALELDVYKTRKSTIGESYKDLGEICELAGKTGEAEQNYKESIKWFDQAKNINPREKMDVYEQFAALLEKQGRTTEALALRKRTTDLRNSIVDELKYDKVESDD